MKYRTEVDTSTQNSSQAEIARLVFEHVPWGARVLDIGCAAGDLGAVLSEHGYEVTGIEADPEAAAIASGRMAHVAVGDLESEKIGHLVSGRFEAVIFGDVLEHLKDPQTVLRNSTEFLSEDGVLLSSIPNVAHGSVRLALLQGLWDYTDEGLLDRTHLRFFTLRSVVDLLRGAQLEIKELYATVLDPLSAGVEIDDEALPGDIVEWVRSQEGSADFQYIALSRLVPREKVGATAVPDVQRLMPVPHPDDAHAQRRQELAYERAVASRQADELARLEPERRGFLISRDNARALEAEAGRLRYEVQARDDDLHQVRMELIQTHARLAAAIEDAQKAHRRLNRLPHVKVRHLAGRLARKVGLR